MFLLACGVLDEAGQETSLERFTAGIVSPIFSNSPFAHVTVAGSSASGLPTMVSRTVSRGVFGLSVETGGTSVGVGGSCGIELLVGDVCWGSSYFVG